MTKRKRACEKVVPHYWHRSTQNKPARKAARTVAPTEYPYGYFTELITKHNWPPRFVPQYRSDKPGPAANARGTGYDRHPPGLPGAAEYTSRWVGR